MTLIGIHNLTKSHGSKTIFQNLSFGIEEGDRIGLIGPNGAGKTTLLKILAGKTTPDSGTLSYQKNLRIGFLEQVPIFQEEATVGEILREGVDRLKHFHDDWELDLFIEQYRAQFELDLEAPLKTLSGGWKKRVALARELISQPDILFLDEPTNHLDVESILWLENFLSEASFATLTVTHDRLFLQRISNRILELDSRNVGGILSVQGDYTDYLQVKDQLMQAQEKREVVLKNTLRRETEWLRRGPKARTTKQQARIQRAHELMDEVDEVSARNQKRTLSIDFQNSSLPKKLLEAKGISKTLGGKLLFSNFDLLFSPGSRVGLLGSNGVGKSTLIRVLLGEEKPDSGEIRKADQLQVSYFEQNRDVLDLNLSLAETLCPKGDYVDYRGQKIHIKSYLDRFLFDPRQMDLPIRQLSGGEQSRILIAKLMLKPANLLVLDEPTNDLDMATLNILQECLTDFEGAVILVTHDRYFLDQVANKIIAFPQAGSASAQLQSFADLSQWEAWIEDSKEKSKIEEKTKTSKNPKSNPVKLSYKEQLEFDSLEGRIAEAEAKANALEKEIGLPENTSNAIRLVEMTQALEKIQTEIHALYERWDVLSR